MNEYTKIALDSITNQIMNKVHKMTFIVTLILSIKLMSVTMHRLTFFALTSFLSPPINRQSIEAKFSLLEFCKTVIKVF